MENKRKKHGKPSQEKTLLEWKAESNTGHIVRILAVPVILFCAYAFYKAIKSDGPWWAALILGVYFIYLFIRSFKKSIVTLRMTDKAIMRFREGKAQQGILAYDRKVNKAFGFFLGGNYMPYDTIKRYIIKKDEIILVPKHRWTISRLYGISLILNNNKNDIVKILDQYITKR